MVAILTMMCWCQSWLYDMQQSPACYTYSMYNGYFVVIEKLSVVVIRAQVGFVVLHTNTRTYWSGLGCSYQCLFVFKKKTFSCICLYLFIQIFVQSQLKILQCSFWIHCKDDCLIDCTPKKSFLSKVLDKTNQWHLIHYLTS